MTFYIHHAKPTNMNRVLDIFNICLRTLCRRQYAESWRKMQELRAQIQAQLKLADTLKKISEAAGGKWQYFRRDFFFYC